MTQMIPLSKLRLSDINVRTTGPALIEQLAADIDARGVLQNLIVTPVTKPRGHFAVFAGGRRFRALEFLRDNGNVTADVDVPCLVLKGDDATLAETSLAENFQRLAMTPADECRAFQHFMGTDGDVDAVAKRFGVTRRFVDGRLRLANLADPVFEALAAGEITLDMAKAYGSTEDRAKQARVFEQYGRSSYVTPDAVRRAIVNDTLKASDPIALLVTADAYVAAGGRIERELFDEGGDRWLDPEIAQTLAGTLMEAEAKRIGEEMGLAWIRPVATTNLYGVTSDLHRVKLPPIPFDEAEQTRVTTIEERCAAIEIEMEDEELGDEAYTALEEEHDTLSGQYRELHDRPGMLPDDLKSQIGTFLMLDARGKLILETSYFSETPIRSSEDGEDHGAGGRSTRDTTPLPPEKVAPGGKPLSARLGDELAVQRRDILAASMLADPALALDYALFSMVDQDHGYGTYGTTIKAGRPQDPVLSSDQAMTQAKTAMAEAREALDADWMENASIVSRFEAFRALDDDAKASWLAYMVASSLEAKPDYSGKTNALHARMATTLEIDVAKWWRPTSENFFDRVSKGTLLALLTEVGGPALAARYVGSKKGEVSASCSKLFAGEAITEAEVKEAALAWVPGAMRFDETAAPMAPVDDIGDTGDADGDEVEPNEMVSPENDDDETLVAAE